MIARLLSLVFERKARVYSERAIEADRRGKKELAERYTIMSRYWTSKALRAKNMEENGNGY
jgi:hypothetical protein